jgi:hypothetical protein
MEKALGRRKYRISGSSGRGVTCESGRLDPRMDWWAADARWWRWMNDADDNLRLLREAGGNRPNLGALDSLLRRFCRFCEVYTDRSRYLCHTKHAGEGPQGSKTVKLVELCARWASARSRPARRRPRGRIERAWVQFGAFYLPELEPQRSTKYRSESLSGEQDLISGDSP